MNGSVARRLPAVLVVAAVAALGSIAVAPAPARAAAEPVTLTVAPRNGGVVAVGKALDLDVDVTNTGTVALPAGRLQFSLDASPAASAADLLQRIADPPAQLQGLLLVHTKGAVRALQPGDSQRVVVRAPAADLDAVLKTDDGARVLYASYDTGATPVIRESAITRMAKGFAKRVRLGVVIPITAPANASGIVDAATQEQLTVPGGPWDDALRAARADPGATIALDPAVPASIRLAGSGAPAGATDFLAALADLPNPVSELPYADTDLTLARAAGAAGVAPASFAGSTAAAPTATATPGPTPAVTAAPATGAATPGRTDLLRWSWSGPSVAWPVAGSTSLADLGPLGAGGRAVLLPGSDVHDTPARVAAGPAATVDGHRVLVADTAASALLTRAGTLDTDGAAALAALVGALSTDAVTGAVPALLAVPERGADVHALARALSLLHRQRWITSSTLASAASGTAPTVTLVRRVVPASEVATAAGLVTGERAARDLGAAIQGAAPLVDPQRLALLGLLSASWRLHDAEWRTAAAAGVKQFTAFVGKVHVNEGSPFVYTGDSGTLTVNVVNELPQPVTVVVTGAASNGRLQVTGDGVKLVVPAEVRSKALLPIRSITNGQVTIAVRLSTPDGAPIGDPVTQDITVRAGFEVIVAVALIAALGLLFLTGIYRNIVRQRRRRPKAVAA